MYSGYSLSEIHAAFCLLLLIVIGLLSWQRRAQAVIMSGTIVLYAQYMIWRGLYTINMDTWDAALISWTVYLAEAYGMAQLGFFALQVWRTTEWESPLIHRYRTVDILVPVVNEPLYILRRTLVSCCNQDYPKDKYRVYVLDDGHREDVRHLADVLGCQYLSRPDRLHAKAGNLNYALKQTSGELIAVFDTDHAPAASFLAKTVGFFEQEKVAFVQTPQHFYNADIFQKNLHLENKIPNEQALFFRVIQAGRDRHNSAFFAGSCGLFRRQALSEVSGFQTGTITEDIHTSLLVHARGYESRYLNMPLAAGLMPETFETFLKQRARWATGTWQMFFRSNPLTLPGLTWKQRINYLAAVWYFGFGLPRLICLVAPAFGLVFWIAPVNAAFWEFGIYYGSYFLASLLMMKIVSRGTRIALWSELYEIAMCFRTSWAVLVTLIQPFKERSFVVTPKGVQQERRCLAMRSVLPHLATIALLILGLVLGVARWLHNADQPGIQITITWGVVNLVLLCATIVSSIDAQQWRKVTRLPRKVPCTVVIGKDTYEGMTDDLSEAGALIRLPAGVQTFDKENFRRDLSLTLRSVSGRDLNVKAQLASQRRTASGDVALGVDFIDIDDETIHALIATMFGDEDIWNQASPQSGIWKNVWWLLSVMRVPFSLSRASLRRSRRIPCRRYCRGIFGKHILSGTIMNVSEDGLMVDFTGGVQQLEEEGSIRVDHCMLHVRRMWSEDRVGRVLAGFRIQRISEGEQYWQEHVATAVCDDSRSQRAA
ncbi:MAG TPA: glycosyltransferase [Nitrospira sp.]|nr:glycosyltransferase [Nitrospira sp.]